MARRGESKFEFIGDGIYRRGKTWWLDCQHAGRRHVARLGKGINATIARELAAVERSKFLRSEAGIGGAKRKDLAFDKAAEAFLAWVETDRRPKTLTGYKHSVANLKGEFAGKRLGEITALGIQQYRERRIKAKAPIAANRDLACLKSLVTRCRALGLFEGPHAADLAKLPRERQGRLRFLAEDEETALLDAAEEPLRTIILTGIYAGLRIQAEAIPLTRPDVDLAMGQLTVQAADAKNGRTRTVPLHRTLREALVKLIERRPGRPGGPIFIKDDGEPYQSIRSAFEAARARAGRALKRDLGDVTPHVLRHTFASRLVMAGVDLRTVQEYGGWSDLEMVQRYAHLSPAHRATAIDRIPTPVPTVPITGPATQDGERAASAVQSRAASHTDAGVAQRQSN